MAHSPTEVATESRNARASAAGAASTHRAHLAGPPGCRAMRTADLKSASEAVAPRPHGRKAAFRGSSTEKLRPAPRASFSRARPSVTRLDAPASMLAEPGSGAPAPACPEPGLGDAGPSPSDPGFGEPDALRRVLPACRDSVSGGPIRASSAVQSCNPRRHGRDSRGVDARPHFTSPHTSGASASPVVPTPLGIPPVMPNRYHASSNGCATGRRPRTTWQGHVPKWVACRGIWSHEPVGRPHGRPGPVATL
jgi:hypothetical protein